MDFDDFADDIQAGGPEQQDDDTVPLEQLEPLEQQPKKPKKAIKKRPKLTLDQLQAPNGLQEVFEKFPKWFQEGYKGKGHEVRDLRRLLELYQRWHPRLFNHCDYNQFETTLEKMSGTNAIKVKLQDMRAKLPELVDPKPPEQEQQDDADNQQQQQQDQPGTSQQPRQHQQQQGGGGGGGGGGGYDEIDDDELMELQALPIEIQVMDELMDEWEPPPPPPPAAAAPQPPAAPAPTAASSHPAGQQRSSAGPSASPASGSQGAGRPAKRNMRDWSDDDDVEDILEAPTRRHQQKLQRKALGSSSPVEDSAGAAPLQGLEDNDLEPSAGAAAAADADTAAPQAGRGRLRKRQVLDDADSDEEGAGAGTAAAPAGLEDLEDEMGLPETGAEAEAAGVVVEDGVGADDGAGEGAADQGVRQPGMKLMMGTEFEGSARQMVLLDDDDDDD